jgi:hypothetical protein
VTRAIKAVLAAGVEAGEVKFDERGFSVAFRKPSDETDNVVRIDTPEALKKLL